VGSGFANAAANKGSVAASIEMTVENAPWQTPGTLTQAGGYASATAIFDDIIISGEGPSVITTANFSVEGTSVFIPSINGGGGGISGRISIEIFDPLLEGSYNFDITSNSNVNSEVGIGSLQLSTGVPITIEMSIFLAAEVLDSKFFNEPASNPNFLFADFGKTVSFSKLRPVFDLPKDYSANSVSANIFDNQWIASGTEGVPVTVPGALSLIGLALPGLLWFRFGNRLRV
jgi:hypothetical protein